MRSLPGKPFFQIKSLMALSGVMLLFFFSGCDRGEIAVPPRKPGDVITDQVELSPNYHYVLYYNLIRQEVVHQHLRLDWDLGFETSSEGWRVVLNTAKGMAAAHTLNKWLKSDVNVNDLVWRNDAPSGNMDSTAIGDWRTDGNVVLIDRGFNLTGGQLGLRKLRIEETETGYRIHYAELASSDSVSFEFTKDETRNFVCISLDGNGSVADIEPNKEDWHLKFTQYTHIFLEEGELLPYSVTGALLNPHLMQGMQKRDVAFADVDLEYATSQLYVDDWNIVGYDWKDYSFDTGSFTVNPNIIYILRSSEGQHWKLRFIDFYNQSGDKGAPMFEFQEL